MPLMSCSSALHLCIADSVAGKTSAVQRAASAPVPDEEHSGITDDELEGHDDGEPDYDFIGRGTLKVRPAAVAVSAVDGLAGGLVTDTAASEMLRKKELRPWA